MLSEAAAVVVHAVSRRTGSRVGTRGLSRGGLRIRRDGRFAGFRRLGGAGGVLVGGIVAGWSSRCRCAARVRLGLGSRLGGRLGG